MKCYRHPDVDSVHSCANCLKAVCNDCLTFEGSRELCPPCRAMISGGNRARTIVVAVLVMGIVGGASYFAWAASQKHQKAPPRTSKEVPPPLSLGEQWKAKLAKEPCDRKLALKASKELLKDNAPRETIAVVDAFVAKCPPLPRLLWDKYTAHERLGEFELAAATASKLIESNPDDPDFYWWRGKALAAAGKPLEAEPDFVQALAVVPKSDTVSFALADVYEQTKRPCDALRVLEDHMGLQEYYGSYPLLEARVERLQKTGSCGSLTGEGKPIVLRFPPNSGTIPVRARFNDSVDGKFVLDTGASMVVISRVFANKLKIPQGKATIWVNTANGRTQNQLASVDVIDVKGARARRVPVLISDSLGPGLDDGLLGMGFLGRFDLRIASAEGRLELSPRVKDKQATR